MDTKKCGCSLCETTLLSLYALLEHGVQWYGGLCFLMTTTGGAMANYIRMKNERYLVLLLSFHLTSRPSQTIRKYLKLWVSVNRKALQKIFLCH